MPDSWLLLALAASATWAISCVADACLIGQRIYRQPSDGAMVAGIFCLVPVALLLPQAGSMEPPPAAIMGSAAAGVCYFVHVYLQFRALIIVNDACNAEIFNTLGVLFVPVLAFGLLGERLAPVYYGAIGVALAGILILLACQCGRLPRPALYQLMLSVFFMSLAMVLQAHSFQQAGYASGVLVFSLATLGAAATVALSSGRRRRRCADLCRRYAGLFVCLELLELAAVFTSQRATDLAPSVSLVALAECALPVFIVLFSAAALGASRSQTRVPSRVRSTLAEQASHLPAKLLSLGFIAFAIAVLPLGVA